MIAFFQSIADFLASIFDLVGNIIAGIIRMLRYIGIAMTAIPQVVAYLPPDLAVLAAAFVAVAVVYLIIGRDTA